MPACSPGSSTVTTVAPWTWCSQVVPPSKRVGSAKSPSLRSVKWKRACIIRAQLWPAPGLLQEAGNVEVVVAFELFVGSAEHVARGCPLAGCSGAPATAGFGLAARLPAIETGGD